MISILQTTAESRGIELAAIGKEGALGAIAGYGLNRSLTASVVQMHLTAIKISTSQFRKHLSKYASLQEMALKSNEVILAQTQITAACNALHNVEQRFCRWLLQTWERSENDTIILTQEFLGEMLGVRRTSVTEIASKLQAAGLIRYRRGQIEVLNRPELEKRSCDCFRAVRHAEKTIMGIELKQ
jgi:CRP-like cAMP-binding protein